MAVVDLDDLPCVREARAKEASLRSRAFLDLPQTLCGVPVGALTLRRLGFLAAAENPFIEGGAVTERDLAVLLWAVSPSFRMGDADAFSAFCARLGDTAALDDLAARVREIGEWLDETFLDAPASGGGGRAPIASPEAVYVELFGEAYGWTADTTLDMPLPQLYGVLRMLTRRKNPDACFIDRYSAKAKRDWVWGAGASARLVTEEDSPVETVA